MIASKMVDDVVVELIDGEDNLQKKLQSLKEQGIRPDSVMKGEGESYTIIFENKKILNEG